MKKFYINLFYFPNLVISHFIKISINSSSFLSIRKTKTLMRHFKKAIANHLVSKKYVKVGKNYK